MVAPGLTIIVIACGLSISKSEIFSAIAHLETLLLSEINAADEVELYIDNQMKHLEKLKKIANDYSVQSAADRSNVSAALANPVFIYKKLHQFQQTMNEIKKDTAEDVISRLNQKRSKLPTDDDLEGAAIALFRLQDTYNLDAGRMADGKIQKGVKKAAKMNAADCHYLATVGHSQNDFYHSLVWGKEAYLRVSNESPPSVAEAEVLDYYAFALYKQDNFQRALLLYQKLYSIDPARENVAESIDYLKNQLKEKDIDYKASALPKITAKRNKQNVEYEMEIYEKLCRGEMKMKPSKEKRFKCYYKQDRPFLRYAPLKAEIVHLRPRIIVFRQIVSDAEMDDIQKIALPHLNRATVHDKANNRFSAAEYRISKSAWFADGAHPVFATVSKRLQDMTDLNMVYAEMLQVNNYGIGGHYEPHFDMALEGEANDPFMDIGWGNRVATVLFYFSQPEAGGATVFTELNITLWPTKGDAAFWYNLRRDGSSDLKTRHAACPVLAGIKWVANKWIHEKDQDIGRPCGLSPSLYE